MKIIFLIHNCDTSFIEKEIFELINNDKISEVLLYTHSDFKLSDKYSNEKLKLVVYPNKLPQNVGLDTYWIWFKEVVLHFGRYKSVRKIKSALSLLRNESRKAEFILNQGGFGKGMFLSYWADNEALILALMKRSGVENLMMTRMHGYDIYEELDGKKGLPWRWLLVDYLDRFVTISKHGLTYFTEKYPYLKSKVNCYYLGINQPEVAELNVCPDNYRVVSCGYVNPHKNIAGIFRALRGFGDISWLHFGDGEEYLNLKEQVEKQKEVKTELTGRVSVDSVLNRYGKDKFTCFISLSTTEGLPVSMMEAMSFGIPVVSTDVGGCSEIVNENTGVLLPQNYTDEDVRNAVKLCAEKFSSPEARKRIQDECRSKFDAKTNYSRFVDFMIEENRKHWEKMK